MTPNLEKLLNAASAGPLSVVEMGDTNAVIQTGDCTIGGVYRGGEEDLLDPAMAKKLTLLANHGRELVDYLHAISMYALQSDAYEKNLDLQEYIDKSLALLTTLEQEAKS